MISQEELVKGLGLCLFIFPFILVIQQLLAVSAEDEKREKQKMQAEESSTKKD